MADPQGTRECPYRFAAGMPAPFREAVLRWWPSTRPGSRVKDWDSLRLNTASPEDTIYGDGHDVLPPNFSDWFTVLEQICASEEVAKAAARFEAAHPPGEDLWRRLLIETLELPTGFMHLDKRTNREKAQALGPLRARIEQVVEMIEQDRQVAVPEFEPRASALPLPAKARDVDSPRVPNALRLDHERRKLLSRYRLHDSSLLRDICTDPLRLYLHRAGGAQEVDGEDVEPVSLAACVPVGTFEDVARAMAARLRAEQEELGNKPDLIQPLKGQGWHRYAVMRLEEVFAEFYGPERLRELSPGPDRMIAALVNAAVPARNPLTPKRVNAIRKELAAKRAIRQKPQVGPAFRE